LLGDAGALDQLDVGAGFGRNHLRELFAVQHLRFAEGLGQLGDVVGCGHDGLCRLAQRAQHVGGRAGRREQADPVDDLHARHARLGGGGNVGQFAVASRAQDRQWPDLA